MEGSSPSTPPPWSGLRRDILSAIAARLPTRLDLLRFRAVSYSWRSAALPPPPPPSSPPLKLPFPVLPNPYLHSQRRGHFRLVESTIYAFQPRCGIVSNTWRASAKTWITRVQEVRPGIVALGDPLSVCEFKNLTESLPTKSLNLLDFRVTEIGKGYGLQFVEQQGNKKVPSIDFNELKSVMMRKVVVSTNLQKIGGDGSTSSFAVLVLSAGKLGVWRMGDKKWKNIVDNRERSHYVDVVFHNGCFYAIDFNGFTIRIDPVSFEFKQVAPGLPRHRSGGQDKYLVSSSEDLFRVDEYVIDEEDDLYCFSDSDDSDGSSRVQLMVYKLNKEESDWVSVDGVGDLALFIGQDCSFSVLAKGFGGLRENSVILNVDSLFDYVYDHPGYSAVVDDLEDDTVTPLRKVRGRSVIWPPPCWLKETSCSRMS